MLWKEIRMKGAHRLRLVPSVFLICWSALNFAQFKTFSTIEDLDTNARLNDRIQSLTQQKTLTLLHKLFRQRGLRTKFRGQQSHSLLSLAIKRRVLDERIDKDQHVLLN